MDNKYILQKSHVLSSILLVLWFPPTSIINTYAVWFNLMKLTICGWVIFRGLLSRRRDYRYAFVWIFCLLMVGVTFNQGNIQNTLLSIVYVVDVLSVFYYFKQNPNIDKLNRFYTTVLVYMIVNAITVLFFPNGITQNVLGQANYLVGGKFSVFYLTILWFMIYLCSKKNIKKVNIICCSVLLIVLSMRSDSSTAAFCSVILLVLLLFSKIQKTVFKPFIILGITAGINVLLIAYYGLLESGVLSYLVEKILHRDLNLTGRIDIYANFFNLIRNDLLFGNGYGNTLISSNLGYLNAQNGFLEIISKVGVVGCVIFVVILGLALKSSFKQNISKKYLKYIWPSICVLLISGTVEISFNMYFFFMLALCFASSIEERYLKNSIEVQDDLEKQ